MAEVLIDSYSFANPAVGISFEAGADAKVGQTFTANGTALARLIVVMDKIGNPTGNMVAKVYAVTGSFGTSAEPTGAVIAQSDPVNMSILSAAVEQQITFTFRGDQAKNLTNATNYAWVVDASSGSVDASNYPNLQVDITSSTHAGNTVFGFSGAWGTTASDAIFELYGTNTPSITTSAPTNVSSTKATLNGLIGGAGTSSIDGRGFVYSLTSHTNPGNTAPGSSSYEGSIIQSGSFSTGAFSGAATALQANSTYYVRAYSHNSSGYSYGDEVTLQTENLTRVSFLSTDPTDMFKNILDSFTSRGGVVDYDGTSTDDTGLSLSYTFNTNTVLEGIKVAHSLAPFDWYWYVDVGTNIAYFKQASTTADHVITKGRHINELKLVLSTQNLKNIVYFTGGIPEGGDENLFKVYSDAPSIAAYDQRLDRRTDNRVTVEATADAYGNGVLQTNKDEKNYTTVRVPDGTYDITLYKPGDMVGFNGFGSFADNLLLQIARIEYHPDYIELSLGELPYRTTSLLDQFNRDILALQTVDNPDSVG